MIPHKEYLERLCDDLNYLFKKSESNIGDTHKFRLDVLIVHLNMDHILTEIIKNKFENRLSIKENKESFMMDGRDFMEKLRIVYSTGDFDEEFFNVFRIINKVRNKLAHKLSIDLNSERDRIKNLKILKSFEELPGAKVLTIEQRLVFGSITYLNSSIEYLYKTLLNENIKHKIVIAVNVGFTALMPKMGQGPGTLEPIGILNPIFKVEEI